MDARFRILSIDGGGIRGLVPALLLQDLERRLEEESGEKRPLSDWFHLFAGTSTGGLISLALTASDREMDATQLVGLYRQRGPKIFPTRFRIARMLLGMVKPKFSNRGLRKAVWELIGESRVADARRDLVIPSYDMTRHEPVFFKRWNAVDLGDPTMAQAAMATASAPTYLPPWELDGRALVDGGVFAANPTVAAISEALKRTEPPGPGLGLDHLFVVSLGTGYFPADYAPRRLRAWGALAWIWPRGSEPALLRAMLDGQTRSAHHWADTLLNRDPKKKRYYRIEATLGTDFEMDDAREKTLKGLTRCAEELIDKHGDDLRRIAEQLVAAGPLG